MLIFEINSLKIKLFLNFLLNKGVFSRFAKYCHGTTSFISQINENLILDIGLSEDIEETLKFMVDERMISFLKRNKFSKQQSPLFDISDTGNFKDKYRIICSY